MTVSQFPAEHCPEHRRSKVLTVMSEMRAAGYGCEDIHIALNAMGFPISRDACRRFVIPKITTASASFHSTEAVKGRRNT